MKNPGVLVVLALLASCGHDHGDEQGGGGNDGNQESRPRTATIRYECQFSVNHPTRKIPPTKASFVLSPGLENVVVKSVRDAANGKWELMVTEQFGIMRLELAAIDIPEFDELEVEAPVNTDNISSSLSENGFNVKLDCVKGGSSAQ